MSQHKSGNGQNLVGAAIAAILGSAAIYSYAPTGQAAEAAATEEPIAELEEVRVTGSRIVRKDLISNSPMVTVDRQQLEDSTFVSVEQALNDLPQFMVGGAGMGGGAVTSLQGANGVDGGRGTGDMFNMSLLPDSAGMIGIVVPGAANVNLRGLGANRSLVLVDGHRGMPLNASMTVDLNTIPSIAIGNIEVITGGASAVYGADALAGVTNIQFRDTFEGMSVRVRGGINAVGDGGEYQIGTLMGGKFGSEKGHAVVGIEYTKREVSYWKERDFFREVMESPYSNSGDFLFADEPYYSAGGTTGTYNGLQRAWNGNSPTLTEINNVFSDRDCFVGGVRQSCVANATGTPFGGGFFMNPDGTLFTRNSQTGTGAASLYFGPQGYNIPLGGTPANPEEVTCTFTSLGVAAGGPFAGERCNPTSNRVDYGRWLSSPREAYTLFGRATFDFSDRLSAFSNFNFATSSTETRREPAPYQGPGFAAIVPFHTSQGGDAVYLPSMIQVPASGQVVGQTRAEYLPGGTKGTSCAPTGGCTMAQAFPLPGDVLSASGTVLTRGELRRLLESRSGAATIATTGVNAANPFRGLNACQQYSLATNPGAVGALVNPTGGASYIRAIDPITGQALANCGPNAGWQINQTLGFLPPRGTENTGNLFQFAAGLRGDLGLSDWTWEIYTSYGESLTQTNYNGFTSAVNYQKIISAPNWGQGYAETGPSSKYFTCTSGINPFDYDLVVSQDCIDAISTNQIDRNKMTQRVHEFTAQGHVADLPAGEMRGSVGASYRNNDYQYTPDSLRERDYINDASAGQFASGDIDEAVSAKEVFGELLIPLLKDLPLIRTLELELGARSSKYSTGQQVETYKALGSWEPVDWLRVRGGYNRAERAPNMSELFATPSGSSQFASIPSDPCRNTTTLAAVFPGPTQGTTLNNSDTTAPAIRAQLQALCSAQINAWGGNNASEYHNNQALWDIAGGAALVVGNPDLKNERGDTWTMGLAFRSPFEHALLSRISGTVDWYEARVTDPIEVVQTGQIINSCYNINGLNPSYALDDPYGFCSLIEREPTTGALQRVFNSFGNQGKLVIRGLDVSVRWSAPLVDMGFANAPGSLSVNISGNYLIDQIQRYGAAFTDDYAGYGGASKIRSNMGVNYNWGTGNRVGVTWMYRLGTQTASNFATQLSADGQNGPDLHRNPLFAGYHANNMFTATAGTRFGPVNASISINNLLDTKPSAGGYDLRDPRNGFGSFSPFDDLVGRRYSINLSMDF